ncbi:MAG TPA: NHL repeat-containing protein [Solirubrobacterales bacterium]|nr:NHL repeat-containing protein [Solirubrobacterales bacterium]
MLAVGLALLCGLTASADAAQLRGRVLAGGRAVAGSAVTLYAANGRAALGTIRSGPHGFFTLSYRRPPAGAVLYAVAAGGRSPAGRALRYLAVADPARARPRRLVLNELSTVAGAYSLSRFLHGWRLSGPAPGLPNAAATVPSLVEPGTGRVSEVLAEPPNGTETRTLATFRTLGAILAECTREGGRRCRDLFAAAKPPRGPRPHDTLSAVQDIALNPANDVRGIFALPKSHSYRPTLKRAPSSWVLSLVHTNAAYSGPGRIAFDSRGNIWVTNNFEPGSTEAGSYAIALDPTGNPRLTPDGTVSGGGVLGNWWGIAVDQRDRVWLSDFTGDDPEEFDGPNFVGGHTVAMFDQDGETPYPNGITSSDLQAPQGIGVDRRGNVWIANHGSASVTMFPGGDPSRARTIRGGGLYNPFAVEADGQGNVWVDNGSLDTERAGSLTRISPAGVPEGPFFAKRMRSPQGMAFDSAGNLWVSSLVDSTVTWFGPDGRVKGQFKAPSIRGAWSVAVDGDDNVWVASFVNRKLTLLCGRTVANCPPGTRTGEPISPARTGFSNGGLQHVTAVQVDQSGNVWVANNWETIEPVVGGDGLVEFIGAAPPVKTPLIGPPQRP